MLLAVGIGVTSVILLVSLGESARMYISDQFSSMGSNLLVILPGRSETVGGPPPLLGITPRDLTLADAASLARISAIRRVSPIIVGAAPISREQKEREVTVLGSSRELFAMRRLEFSQGAVFPESGDRFLPLCVLGSKAKQELFGNDNALGEKIRIGDYRFQITGVLKRKATSLGDELEDAVFVPVGSAQALFNTSSLFRIVVEAESEVAIPRVKEAVIAAIRDRHDGEDDITVITQDAILATFNRIFKTLTLSVAGIAAISLVVSGIIIMNVMLVAVSSRRAEIGLLKALGSSRRLILTVFLAEAAMISGFGALAGLGVGLVGIRLLAWFLPQFPIVLAPWAPVLGFSVAVICGLLFGFLPARRAAALVAADALARR
ncbi:MAG: ABC transporter permease [Proteobacteria bacterium]|nr:FtsX-like permease family protein [Desulfobulbaceae bacterium]MBU4152624.1 ABC transporter permease [Pseudomonadota bacterium]